MLHNFFKLDQPFEEWQDSTAFKNELARNNEISNKQYTPDRMEKSGNFRSIDDKSFKKVSFSKTRIEGLSFRNCRFEDCLFIATDFVKCEFQHCVFKNCNMYKISFEDVFVDPDAFRQALDPDSYANIGVHLYQNLSSDLARQNQHALRAKAEYLFEKWTRYQLHYEYEHQRISRLGFCIRRIWRLFWEVTTGYGWKPQRLVATILALYLFLIACNSLLWNSYGVRSTIEGLDGSGRLVNYVYYTTTLLTTLGPMGLSPTTSVGLVFASVQAVAGVIFFAMLASLMFRLVVRTAT